MARSAVILALLFAWGSVVPSPRAAADPAAAQPESPGAPTTKHDAKHHSAKPDHKAPLVRQATIPSAAAAAASPPKSKPTAPSAVPTPAQPAPSPPSPAQQATGDASAEPKPSAHFASLRSDKVNMHNGPSGDFPVLWTYVRKGLPMEVLATYDLWRKVRDPDGVEGWVHQQMLTGRRNVLVTGATRGLRREPQPAAEIVANLEPGVVAQLAHCNPDWCEIKAGGYRGWLKRDEIWGLEPGEIVE
jgi:SH3-like domain-containing protein